MTAYESSGFVLNVSLVDDLHELMYPKAQEASSLEENVESRLECVATSKHFKID